jgi:AICAR transformylase/IMP cyclohydrolase PurH
MEAMIQPGGARAATLLSVSDKTGSSTSRAARGLGSSCVDRRHAGACGSRARSPPIEDFTGFPEIMGGRGTRLRSSTPACCVREAHGRGREHEIEFVDLVCVTSIRSDAAARRGATEHEVIERSTSAGRR